MTTARLGMLAAFRQERHLYIGLIAFCLVWQSALPAIVLSIDRAAILSFVLCSDLQGDETTDLSPPLGVGVTCAGGACLASCACTTHGSASTDLAISTKRATLAEPRKLHTLGSEEPMDPALPIRGPPLRLAST
ncbi:MAG: hypothetical protein AAGF59_13030 [Pseudomonadota bacterium]